MADPRVKQIKIKTGVVKRLSKEVGYYEKEVSKEEERFEKMKADGADEYQLKKQTEVINESKAMVPDTKNRLIEYRKQLKDMLDAENDLAESEEHKDAVKIVQEADKVLDEKN